jgi:hypothetical protein
VVERELHYLVERKVEVLGRRRKGFESVQLEQEQVSQSMSG